MCKHITWQHGINGYLSENEKLTVNEIDNFLQCINFHGRRVDVVISIEGGNQFHIVNNQQLLLGYMNAEQCLYALKGIFVTMRGVQNGNANT